MKKACAMATALLLLAGAVQAQPPVCGGSASTVAGDEAKACTVKDTMAGNIGRGFRNLLTCWLEVPRNLWLEGSRNPLYGWVVGAMDGSFLTVARAFGGATDVTSFGLTGPGIYGETLPECIMNSPWKAPDALIYRTPDEKN